MEKKAEKLRMEDNNGREKYWQPKSTCFTRTAKHMKHMQGRKQNWEVKEKKVVSSIELGSR